MLPGVGVFGTGQTVRSLVSLLQEEGFPVQAVWGRTQEEAERLADDLSIPFATSQSDDVLLRQEVHLVCILTPPPHTRQIAVKALGETRHLSPAFFISNVCVQNRPGCVPSSTAPIAGRSLTHTHTQELCFPC